MKYLTEIPQTRARLPEFAEELRDVGYRRRMRKRSNLVIERVGETLQADEWDGGGEMYITYLRNCESGK